MNDSRRKSSAMKDMTKNRSDIVKSQFGAAAADYATSEVHAKGESLERIVALAAPQPQWHVLDVATGAGHLAAAFAPHVAHIVASDITDEMLREAAKLAASRNLTNMTTATAEAGALPFANETFDLVCCRLAAHHFPDLERFVSEAHRVLKKGGRLALVDNVSPDHELLPDASDADLEEATTAYNAFEKLRDPGHGFAPPPKVWIELLESHGFLIVAREQFGKELAFAPWVDRMRCAPSVVSRLENILNEGAPELRKFLQPRRDNNGALHFTLQELLLVAGKQE
jgi:ubiquinone/menaquinone biosynthesis C-methylase UbiE